MFSGCKALIYLNIRSFKIYSGVWTEAIFRSTPSYLKICLEDSPTKELLSSTGKTFDCSNTCFNKEINFKLDLVNHECVTNCNQHYEYGNYCYSSCPAGTYPKEDEYSCLKYLEKGYYISYYLENNVYKKCYETCNTCKGGGNQLNHNCVDCISGFNFLTDSFKELYGYLKLLDR